MELHELAWGKYHQIDQCFGIKKVRADLRDIEYDGSFFDKNIQKFSPSEFPNKIEETTESKFSDKIVYTPESKTSRKLSKKLVGKTGEKFDLVYFDAFAPTTQPELWSREVFSKIYDTMSEGGVLVTYSVMGKVRRGLQSLGFKTERLEGPPGKRHMLRATKPL